MNKKSKKKVEKVAAPKKNVPDNEKLIPEKPFDFGGLPERNLKKNLGCG